MKAITSNRKAKALGLSVFFLGIGIITFKYSFWPAILIPLAASISLRQFLMGKIYEAIMSLIVFVGAFAATFFNVSWNYILSVIFILGGIYVLSKEFFESEPTDLTEVEEDINHEIEEKIEK